MKKLYNSIIVLFLMIAFTSSYAFAQPVNSEKATQRIMAMKKVKLLEILNLSEDKADKFLVKYNASENKVMSLSEQIDNATNELRQVLDAKTAKVSEIKQKTDAILKLQDELYSAMTEKVKGMQSILSEEEFAKYILFERKFSDELRRHIMERPNRCRQNDNAPPPPPKKKKRK